MTLNLKPVLTAILENYALPMAGDHRILLSNRPQLAEHFHSSMLAILDFEDQHGSLNEKWYRCCGLGHGYIRVEAT